MGIRSDIQTSIAEAFDGDLSDAVVSAVLTQNAQSYTPGSGVVNSTTDYNTRLVASPIRTDLVDGEAILASDVNCIILQNELSATPKVKDVITFNGVDHDVRVVRSDPAQATWELIVRAV